MVVVAEVGDIGPTLWLNCTTEELIVMELDRVDGEVAVTIGDVEGDTVVDVEVAVTIGDVEGDIVVDCSTVVTDATGTDTVTDAIVTAGVVVITVTSGGMDIVVVIDVAGDMDAGAVTGTMVHNGELDIGAS